MNTVQSSGTGGHGGGKKDKRDEELVVSSPSERNWRGIFIALLVIVAVLGLIVFSIVLVSPPEEGPRSRGAKPTLEDIFSKLPPPAEFNGTWLTENEFVYKDEHGGVTLYNADNLTTRIIMTNSTFRQYDATDFRISSDLRYVLLVCEARKVYQHTILAKYYIYEIQTRLRKPLSPKELDDSAPFLQHAAWSPDGTAVVFVHHNDIYYKPRIEKDLVCRITSTGIPSTIYNGVPDWLYENEILRTSHAVWFSPDSLYLLYLTFNDTKVGEYKYPWYDSKNPRMVYPQVKSFRFPTVETANPEATIWMVNLTRPKYLFPVQLKPTNSVEVDSYVTSASFHGVNSVAIVWLNRKQNVSVIVTCQVKNYNCTEFHVEREHIGWSERIFHPVFSKFGNQSLVRLPVKDGDNGHFMHACLLFGDNVVPLTHGAFELSRILAWDEQKHLIYALASNENAPGVRHLFKIGDTNSTQPWTCLTCQPKIDPNATFAFYPDYLNESMLNDTLLVNYACEYNNVYFSKNYKYYVQECLGPDVPVVFLVETASNMRLAVLDSSARLRKKIKSLSAPQVKTIQVEIEYGYKSQVRLFLPPILREYEEVTFPLILLVDAAPSSQTVSSKWQLDWAWYLASTRSYNVARIDARGSGFQGVRMRRELKNRIGSIEVQDQLAVLTYIRDTFKFIDRSKICVVGKGYGGYVATMMMLQDYHQIINCSVAISPITNWKFYNSYFTERYLGLPSKNAPGYDSADLTMRAGNLNERRYLVVHGTADTTVTPLHTFMFANALIEQEVLFHQVVYPDERHDFTKKTLLHMYKEIDQFFNDSFGPIVDDWEEESSFFIP